MGEVHRATDTNLGRDVAIKVLPAELARDPERLARFEREAKLLASLNHPNVAHVYGFESATLPDGSAAHFLAMELVPGEDLAERLKRGPIPVDEALAFSKQIAEALGEAHEKGIVHRDLKPANVKVTPDAKVKVLDFGLAKAFSGDAASGSSPDLSQSPTLAHTGTQAGLILGTAAYMSPEQARGRAVDKRADVWAFARRLHDIADARLLLEDAGPEPAAPSPTPVRAPRRREATAWLLAVVGIGAAAALAWKRPASRPAEPLTRFAVSLPSDQPLAFLDAPTLALSPDGRKLALTVSGAFTVGSIDSPNDYDKALLVAFSFVTGERRVVAEGVNMAGFVAPDTLVYSRAGVLFTARFDVSRLEVVGRATPALEGVAGDPSSGATHFAVADDGTLAAVRGAGSKVSQLLTIVDRKGVAQRLPLTARGFRHPRFSPDGKRLAFTVGSAVAGISSDGDVWVYSLSSGSLDRLTFDGSAYPAWTPTGDRIAYIHGNQAVFAKAADGTGTEDELVAPGSDALLPGSWSADGRTLALTRVAPAPGILFLAPGDTPRLVEADASAPAFSPDGRWIAYQSPASGDANVFVRSATGEGKWQVSAACGSYPRWSGDGRELFYIATGNRRRALMAVEVASASGFRTGPPRVVVADLSRYMTSTAPQMGWDAAPDGRRFVFIEAERAKDEGTRIDVALHWARHLGAAGPAPAP